MARFKRAPRRYTKKYSKKRVFRKRFGKKTFRRGRKAVGQKAQTACAHETISFSDVTSQTMGNRSVQLNQCPRLIEIAGAYRYYKITKVEWRYENYFNMAQYAASATGGQTVPNMYWVMDRQGIFPYTTLAQLQDLGQKGTKFTSVKKISYAPSVQQVVNVSSGVTISEVPRAMKAPWFPTADAGAPTGTLWQAMQHYGHSDYFDNEGIAGSSQISQLTCTVYAEFKEPAIPTT
nr:MAG: capsid protein [Cressdnaviricota sp.]